MKKYYYVQVVDFDKLKFVTSFDYEHRVSYWEDDKPFMQFLSKSFAEEIVLGLVSNGIYAFVVQSPVKLYFTNIHLKR